MAATKKKLARRLPEPTTHSPYDSYLFPRSKTPAKQALYDFLAGLHWRFDTENSLWVTPETHTFQAAGRLEYDRSYKWARVQPPNAPGSDIRKEPILTLVRTRGTWRVG